MASKKNKRLKNNLNNGTNVFVEKNQKTNSTKKMNKANDIQKQANTYTSQPKSLDKVKHDESFLANGLNKIKNIATSNLAKNNIVLSTTNSKYMESEKTGMDSFIRGSEMLNNKVLKELGTMTVLKDNYRALEEKLRFDVNLKSDVLDYSTMNLSLLAANSQFIKQYEKDHPCIPKNSYTKDEAIKLYGKYFNDPNISGFFDMFYDKKSDTYTVPDIVFNSYDETTGRIKKTTETKYEIIIDTNGFNQKDIIDNFMATIESLDPHIDEGLTDIERTGLWFMGKSNITNSFVSTISYTNNNGVLTIDMTELMKLLNDLDSVANSDLGKDAATDADRKLIKEAITGLKNLFKK